MTFDVTENGERLGAPTLLATRLATQHLREARGSSVEL
jgi:hypothetical protein